MRRILEDLRYAVRSLSRSPGYVAVAVVTLALGIGANTAIFSVVNGVLLRPLPFAEPDELVYPHAIMRGEPFMILSSPVFLALREDGQAFQDVAIFGGASATFAGDGEPEQIQGAAISANYFGVTGIAPLRGRLFREEENEPGNTDVILLSEQLWRERYGADESIVGSTVELSGRTREIVGIMPAHASFPPEWRFWTPYSFTPGFRDPANVGAFSYNVVARLKPERTAPASELVVPRLKTSQTLLRPSDYSDFNYYLTPNLVRISEREVLLAARGEGVPEGTLEDVEFAVCDVYALTVH